MSRFYRKKLNAQGKYINPPVHAKREVSEPRIPTGRPVVMYKMDKGPRKETTIERQDRIRAEATKRWIDRLAKKEADREAKKLAYLAKGEKPRGRPFGYKDSAETIARKSKAGKKRWRGVLLTKEEKRLKRNAYQNARNANRNSPEACARVVERLRLRAEAKKKSTSVVITITITDPNKS